MQDCKQIMINQMNNKDRLSNLHIKYYLQYNFKNCVCLSPLYIFVSKTVIWNLLQLEERFLYRVKYLMTVAKDIWRRCSTAEFLNDRIDSAASLECPMARTGPRFTKNLKSDRNRD